MKYRLMTSGGSISYKLFSLKDAQTELNGSGAIIAIVSPNSHRIIEVTA